MKKFYIWKVLTGDGLLKDHGNVGPHWSTENLDGYYETEEHAVKAYSEFKEAHEYSVENEMVLITVYITWKD
jgi:hypothetical protein